MADYKKYEPFFGSWYIKRRIGAGSFGEVFEIERTEFGKTYRSALKMMTIPFSEEEVKTMLADGTDIDSIATYYEGLVQDIAEENAIMSELKGNSYIVSYEDHQIIPHEDGVGYDILIRMELLTPLVDYMIHNQMTESDVLKLGMDLCQALSICEKKNILHRDIKPGNIFISDTGDYKLGDFGIARTIEKTTGEMSRKGTFTYMAPEVYKGESYGTKADIYSLGIVMYYLLNCKRTPFLPLPPETVTYNIKMEALRRRMDGEPLPPPKDANPALAEAILKACAYDQNDRYESAEEFYQALQATGEASHEPLGHVVQKKEEVLQEESDETNKTVLLKENAQPGDELTGSAATGGSDSGSRAGSKSSSKPVFQRGVQAGSADPYRDMEETVLDTGQFSARDYEDSLRRDPSWPGTAGGMAGGVAGGVERSQGRSQKGSQKNSGKGKMFALIAAAVLIVVLGIFFIVPHGGGGEEEAQVEPGVAPPRTKDGVTIQGSDINYSQLKTGPEKLTLSKDGVDMLIQVHNDREKPLRAFKFKMSLKGWRPDSFLDDINGEEEFEAIGYVRSGETGYMYVKLYLPNQFLKHPKQAGPNGCRVFPMEVTAEGELADYKIPRGKLTGKHDRSDCYPARIKNKNENSKIYKGATILAIHEDIEDQIGLDQWWGAGTINDEIAGGKTKNIKRAIYNPGFKDEDDYDEYEVMVLDEHYLKE